RYDNVHGNETTETRRRGAESCSPCLRVSVVVLFYPRSMRRTEGVSASDTRVDLRRPRLRPVAFLVRMCRFMEWPRFTLPVAVSLNRLTAPRLLLSFSFVFGFRMSSRSYSLTFAFGASAGASFLGRGALGAPDAAALGALPAPSPFSLPAGALGLAAPPSFR